MYLQLQIYHEVHFLNRDKLKKYRVSSHNLSRPFGKIISIGADGLNQMMD